ncbi:MAG: NfeD family protein [Pseudomonadota bacterium]
MSSKALEIGVIDLLARDVDEMLEKADGLVVEVAGEWKTLRCKGALVEHHEMSFGSKVVNTFANPNVSYLLFMAGILGIAMEMYHPGVIFPGVLGAISLLLAFISFQIVPVNVGGILLILVGAGMLVAEAFLPSFGALGIGGAAAVVIGGMILVDDVDPNLWAEPSYGVSPWAMWPTVIATLGVLAFTGVMVMRSRQRPPVTGAQGMVGQPALTLTEIGAQGGKVQHGPETWAAFSSQVIPPKTRVRIVAVDGLKLTVVPLDDTTPRDG